MAVEDLLKASWNALGDLLEPKKVLLKPLGALLEASWDPIATPKIEGMRPEVVIQLVLGGGGEEPGGGEQTSRQGSLSSRTVGQRSRDPWLQDSRESRLAGLVDRGKDYSSQPDAPGKQGPADYSITIASL